MVTSVTFWCSLVTFRASRGAPVNRDLGLSAHSTPFVRPGPF